MEFEIMAAIAAVVLVPVVVLLALFARIRKTERRLTEMERRLAQLAAGQQAVGIPALRRETVGTPETGGAPALPTPAGRSDLELLIAGRWLNYVGIVALLFGVAFFLKYAFENNWVGPAGRVAIGLLCGAALLAFSHVLLGRGYRYFSEGIAGLGSAVLYLSLYAGRIYYHLFALETAFAGMAAVVTLTALLSLGRGSPRIAGLSAIGGFLTPILLSTNSDQQFALFTYVALLDAALLALAETRAWQSLQIIALAGTQFYFWGWYAEWWSPERLTSTLAFAVVFFLLFFAGGIASIRRHTAMSKAAVIIALLNAFTFLLALHQTLWPPYKWGMTVAVLALSAVHLAAARYAVLAGAAGAAPVPGQTVPGGAPAAEEPTEFARLMFAGLALTFATIAIPVRLEGKWITMAWAVEGALLAWQGFRLRLEWLRWGALALLFAAAFRLYFFPVPGGAFIMNARFAAYLVTVACFGAALLFARAKEEDQRENERFFFGVAAVLIHVLALTALSQELWRFFAQNPQGTSADPRLAQQLALSLLWSAYAAVLIAGGVRGHAAALRWQGLALFGLAAGKVFFFDLPFLERGYRILSFMVLGLLLLVVSFLYQRRVVATRSGDGP